VGSEAVRAYIRQVVDVVVQLKRIDGVRQVTSIDYIGGARSREPSI
jgi:hypothetical protein